VPPSPITAAPRVGESDTPPKPLPAPRVAPLPAPAPEPLVDTAPAEETPRQPSLEPLPEAPEPAEPAAAPPEATTEIVTEAEQETAAPRKSPRPTARPRRQAAVAATETPAETAEPPVETPDQSAAIAAALAEAVAAAEAPPSPAGGLSGGGGLTAREKDAFRLAISRCWNVGSLSSEALRVTVTVAVTFTEDGRPVADSIRMISADGGSGRAARRAFEAARRAVIRCGASGYDLPPEKYADWREVELVFNPERMRIK